MQTTSHLLMIKPVQFGYNEQTAINNSFQANNQNHQTQENALTEFNNFVSLLQQHSIDVTVVEDTITPHTPDSIFPNNWISFHDDGTIILYPMFAENRRSERKQSVIEAISNKFQINYSIDYTPFENEHLFLEGTGSMILDRVHQIVYACISQRTSEKLVNKFCNDLDYHPILFHATDANNQLIYHTNVMMCLADEFAIVCMESIQDNNEKDALLTSLEQTAKELITISLDQMNHFAGNMLQVNNSNNEKFLIMSSQAFESLTEEQIASIEKYNTILHSNLLTIETNGGGSARCMMAEIFLPLKENDNN